MNARGEAYDNVLPSCEQTQPLLPASCPTFSASWHEFQPSKLGGAEGFRAFGMGVAAYPGYSLLASPVGGGCRCAEESLEPPFVGEPEPVGKDLHDSSLARHSH